MGHWQVSEPDWVFKSPGKCGRVWRDCSARDAADHAIANTDGTTCFGAAQAAPGSSQWRVRLVPDPWWRRCLRWRPWR